MIFAYIDTETTGVDPDRHGIIQIAGFIIRDGREVERFDFMARPFPGQEIDESALRVNGYTREEIAALPDPSIAFGSLYEILTLRDEKPALVGWNVRFDYDFLCEFFRRNGNDCFYKLVYFPPIDVAVLAHFALMKERKAFPNFKLATVARYLGIDFDETKLHDALEDITLTREVMLRVSQIIRGSR